MRWTKIITHAIVATLAMPALLAATGDSNQPFTISISAAKPIVRAGEDILIHVVLTNVSDHGIRIPPATLDAACDYIVHVQGEKGLVSGKTDCSGSHIMGLRQLKPGESIEGDITLNDISHYDSKSDDVVKTFDFTSPGEYEIQLSRHIEDDPAKEIVKSNKITITVTE